MSKIWTVWTTPSLQRTALDDVTIAAEIVMAVILAIFVLKLIDTIAKNVVYKSNKTNHW